MNSEPIRVVIVDEHSLVRSSLRLFLTAFDDMLLVGEAANGLEAVRFCEQVKPDIVLMDLIMPVMDGMHATRELIGRFPQVRVIGMTSFLKSDLIQEALQSGMTGLVSKDVSTGELAQAIRDARAGRPTFSAQVARLLQGSAPAETRAALPVYDLTAREREVLALMVSGSSNAEIAERLVISLSTAKFHASSIFEKLNVANRAEAVSLALQYHIVDALLPPEDSQRT